MKRIMSLRKTVSKILNQQEEKFNWVRISSCQGSGVFVSLCLSASCSSPSEALVEVNPCDQLRAEPALPHVQQVQPICLINFWAFKGAAIRPSSECWVCYGTWLNPMLFPLFYSTIRLIIFFVLLPSCLSCEFIYVTQNSNSSMSSGFIPRLTFSVLLCTACLPSSLCPHS